MLPYRQQLQGSRRDASQFDSFQVLLEAATVDGESHSTSRRIMLTKG